VSHAAKPRVSDRRWPARLAALVAGLLLLTLAPFARAAEIAGQDDPRFVAALELWLADDEAEALPALAALAAGGNRAAQILLALVDATPAYQGPWLARLPRPERLRLMRAPGGLSGRSWMQAAAEDTPLARLWLERQQTTSTVATPMAFAALGEERAARVALQALAARQYRGFAAVADDPNYPPDLRHLVWREWASDPGGRARATTEIAALLPGDPQIGRFENRPVTPDERDAWLATAPLAAPLRATCEAACPQSVAACTRAAYALVDGHTLLAAFGTPSETLIPPEVWNASRRGRVTLLRVAPARLQFADAVFAEVAAEDQCLARALGAETARYFN
jgi:hypothetical protein